MAKHRVIIYRFQDQESVWSNMGKLFTTSKNNNHYDQINDNYLMQLIDSLYVYNTVEKLITLFNTHITLILFIIYTK